MLANPAREYTPTVELHLDLGENAATLYARESTGHDAHVSLDLPKLRDHGARVYAAIAALSGVRVEDPSLQAIERSIMTALKLLDERGAAVEVWRTKVYAAIIDHAKSACPEAVRVAAGGGL